MSVKAQEKDDLILYRNEEKIQSEINQVMQYASHFQPFIDELFNTSFRVKPDIESIRVVITSKSFESFMKREALQLSPGIASLEMDEDVKLNQVSPAIKFKNYDTLKKLYEALPKQEYTRWQINEFELDENNQLILPGERVSEITNKYTVYADSKEEKEAFLKASRILDDARELFKKTGFALIYPNAVSYMHCPTGDQWTINPGYFKARIKEKLSK